MSERASKILIWLQQPTYAKASAGRHGFPIRQQTLADELGCSRRSIGRALKELKEAGLLVDLNERHQNRCKMYHLVTSQKNTGLTPQAQLQWEKFAKTFKIVFVTPDLEQHYASVTWGLKHVTEEMDLWQKTWAGLRVVYGWPPL